jgi:hypothetical protein
MEEKTALCVPCRRDRNRLPVDTGETARFWSPLLRKVPSCGRYWKASWYQNGRESRDQKLKWAPAGDKKPSGKAALILAGIAYVAVATVVVSAVILLTITGCTRAAMRRRSRKNNSASNTPRSQTVLYGALSRMLAPRVRLGQACSLLKQPSDSTEDSQPACHP